MTEIPRIAPLAVLPLFHRLEGRRAVVVGESEGATWKAELLTAAGALVEWVHGDWNEGHLAGAALAVADLAELEDALRFIEACRRSGALVNLIDQPQQSDVLFGTIVNRTPVVIGISTDGAAPMLGQSIRSRIEVMLPSNLASWARAAQKWRPRLKQKVGAFAERRNFWQRFVAAVWRESGRAPTEADFDRLIEGTTDRAGCVTFVTAVIGDPELLTLKTVRALRSATVIVHDDRFGPSFLDYGRREARRIAVGRSVRARAQTPNEISAMIRELCRAGEEVVLLTALDDRLLSRAAILPLIDNPLASA